MKRSILTSIASLFLLQGLSAQDNDPAAFLINGEEVTKSEFEYIYRKNNSSSAIEKKSLAEYVDLFVNFKLKVAQAKDLWYDHSKSFKHEFEQYENQLTFPYLRDSILEDRLLHEAYERSAYSVGCSHILVSAPENSSDTSEAFSKITDIYNQLKNGASFAELAKSNSDCPSKKDGGDIGVVNVFSTVYPFECKAYTTPVGSFSEPFRTRFGYHIVKVNSRNRIIKDLRFSHILLSGDEQKAEKMANKLCAQLKKGKLKFADAAKKYSDDTYTNSKGGDWGYIADDKILPPDFVDRLKTIGEVGKYDVVKSMQGIHVVTITDVISTPDFDSMKDDLKAKMAKSDRGENNVNDIINRLKVQNNLRVFTENVQPFYEYVMLGDAGENNDARDSIRRLLTEPLFEYKGNVYSQKTFYSEFLKALNSHYPEKDVDPLVDAKKLTDVTLDNFLYHFVWDGERAELRKKNPEYSHLLNEYRDGLLLFEISSKKVWTKAAKDKEGLAKYFAEHKDKYTWNAPKFKGAIIRCANKETLDKVNRFIANYDPSPVKGKNKKKAQPQPIPYDSINVVLDREFNKEGAIVVKVTKGLYAKGANADVDALVFDKTESVANNNSDFPFVTTSGKVISAPESYTDVKGPLTADYQNYLEEQWVDELHGRYPVIKYPAVINSIEE